MRSIKICGWLGLLFVASSIVSFIGFSGNVNAASSYYNELPAIADDITAWELKSGSCSPLDIGDNWSSWADPDDNSVTPYGGYSGQGEQKYRDLIADLRSYINNGDGYYVFVSKYEYGIRTLDIIFSKDKFDLIADDKGYMADITANKILGSSELRVFHYSFIGNNCNAPHVGISDDATSVLASLVTNTSEHRYEIIGLSAGLEVDWSEDYTGEGIPEDIYLGDTTENLYPHFKYLVNDKEIKATNDVTQELPDLPEPDEGWTNNEWKIMWYLFSCSEIDEDDLQDCTDREIVNSKMLNRDQEYKWEVDEYGDYLLQAEFRYESCYRYPSYPDTPDYCILSTEHEDYSFVPGRTVPLYIDGMNIVGNTAELNCDVAGKCYDDTRFKDCNVIVAFATLSFDNFDYADCLKNIELLANMLSFDTIRFSNSWVSNGNCYTLGTLGNWLNLDNKLVCPYFSNEVRNTITPFITFILGLIMVRFIAGKGEHGQREVDI